MKNLLNALVSNTPKKSISEHSFSSDERKRGEELLKQCPVHSYYRQKIMKFLLNFLIMIAD